MKVSYISDLHLDFHVPFHMSQDKWKRNTERFVNELTQTDTGEKEVLVVAGDLSHFNQQSAWALAVWNTLYELVVVTYGNHDLYLISNNQEGKYKHNSMNRIHELQALLTPLDRVVPLFNGEVTEYKGVTFAGMPLWYPIETIAQQLFFQNVSNDSKLIQGCDLPALHQEHQHRYAELSEKSIDVMVTHFPVINIDTHFQYNSTACYLTPVDKMVAPHWVFGHSHEQKIYDKPYGTFYMNALGYPEEGLEKRIQSFVFEKNA